MLKKIAIGAVGLFVLLIAIGAALGGDEEKPSITSADSPPQQAAQDKPSLPPNQAQIGNLLLTVNGAQLYNDRVFPAEAGTHYVAVDISGKNTGNGTYALNPLNFRLKDSSGFTNNTALTSGPDPKLGHVDMVAGQEVRAYIVFKVGDGRSATELQYQSFTGTPGVIKLNGP